MGFGLLLIGYILAFAFSLSSIYFFADFVGGLVMAYAFSKLSAFDKKFSYAILGSLLFSMISVLRALNGLVFHSQNTLIYDALFAAAMIVVHLLMFNGIISITGELELNKIRLKAKRNLVVMIIYFTLDALIRLSYNRILSIFPESIPYINRYSQIFEVIWLFMNVVLIGSCLKWIGVEGEEMPQMNPSKMRQLNTRLTDLEDKVMTPKEKRGKTEVNDEIAPVHPQRKRRRK